MHILRTRTDANSPWVEIDTLIGPVGPKGEKGEDYILTEADKSEIADKIDLSTYATQEFVSQKIAEAELAESEVDLSAYYTKSEVDNAIEEAQTDLSNYTTKAELEAQVKAAVNESVNLPNYYTKSEVDALIPDTSGFIKTIPAEYITETELAAKGYQTQAQVIALITSNLPASGEEVSY